MLKQRVITGIIYALCVFAVIFLLPRFVATVAYFLLCIGCFIEWMTLAGVDKKMHKIIYTLLFFTGSLLLLLCPVSQTIFIQIGAGVWIAITAWLLFSVRRSRIIPLLSSIKMLLAYCTLLPLLSGLIMIASFEQGPWLLLMLFVIVWSSDTFAYFIGSKWGRHKVAPIISPGKSIEGLVGAMLLTVLVMYGYVEYVLHDDFSITLACVFAVGVVIALVGDLFESALKRLKGVKDSGTLLPGHGGLLDRFDSLIALTPFLALLLTRGVA